MSTPKSPADLDAYALDTRYVLAGRDPAANHGFINTPITRGSTVLFPTMEALQSGKQAFVYGTKGTPTTRALEEAWTALSGAAGTVLVPSGLAAIGLALEAFTRAGDHVLVVDSIYRPGRNFCEKILKKGGVEVEYFDPLAPLAEVAALFRPNTSVLFLEAPGSQSFEVCDVPGLAALAREKGAVSMLDNTWATPILFPPHANGVDVAIEAGTKYLGGHSDLLLGLVSANAATFPRLREIFDVWAIPPGPEDVFLALRGLRTMPLRLREAEKRALAMAEWFAGRPEVARVLHPAFPSCPGHDHWKRDFKGSSGLFSIILKPASKPAVAAMLDGLKLFGMGFSWAGYESLVTPFDCSPYRTATHWRPEGPALRFQIGLEDLQDLQRDLDEGFGRLKAVG
jgi:cysteine-S-conjugate beta-lyase